MAAFIPKNSLSDCLLGRSATVGRRSLIRRLMSVWQRSLADPYATLATVRYQGSHYAETSDETSATFAGGSGAEDDAPRVRARAVAGEVLASCPKILCAPVTNAYTESANSLARVMNRMGRGYSFDVICARMLYDPKARKDGTHVQQRPDTDAPTIGYMLMKSIPAPKVRYVPEVVEYGAYLPTLERLADEGYFD